MERPQLWNTHEINVKNLTQCSELWTTVTGKPKIVLFQSRVMTIISSKDKGQRGSKSSEIDEKQNSELEECAEFCYGEEKQHTTWFLPCKT